MKECGDDNQCLSNLQFEVEIDLPKDEDSYILRSGEYSQALLTFTVTNLGEAAYLTRVYLQKPSNLDYQGVSGQGQVCCEWLTPSILHLQPLTKGWFVFT